MTDQKNKKVAAMKLRYAWKSSWQTDFVLLIEFDLMILIESHGSESVITKVYTALGCKKNVAHPVNIYKHY